MQILNQRQIKQKIKRLAIEMLENNYEESEIYLLGINNRGYSFAQLLQAELNRITKIPIILTRLRLSPAAPLDAPIELEMAATDLQGKTVIIVDDVANTGRTMFYAFKPIMDILPKKVQVAVLVDRKHKAFPIQVDYVGLSLATTLKENIDVQILQEEEPAVFLN
ncbi:MAG: phosphoribosyltransferase family protein [Saprospiraceae bacterium]